MIAITVFIACSSGLNERSGPRHTDTDTDTIDTHVISTNLDTSSLTTADSGTTNDTDNDTAGGGHGGLYNYRDITGGSLTINGETEYYAVDPTVPYSAFGMVRVEPQTPGACSPTTAFTLEVGELAAPLLPIHIAFIYLDDGNDEQNDASTWRPALEINEKSSLVDESTLVLGGTVTYSLLADGSHQFDWENASLCTVAIGPENCPSATVSLNLVGLLRDLGTMYSDSTSAVLVNGTPRCEFY